MFDKNQWRILAQVGAAAAIVLIGVYSQDILRAVFSLPTDDVADRIGYAIQWLLLPGIMLIIGIQGVSSGRFLSEAVDGTRTPTSHRLEINLRYNQNTLEQAFLASIAWLGLSVALPHQQLVLIPFFAILFVVGRLCFWIGYAMNPIARAFGMLLTSLPTIGSYVWLLLDLLQ